MFLLHINNIMLSVYKYLTEMEGWYEKEISQNNNSCHMYICYFDYNIQT